MESFWVIYLVILAYYLLGTIGIYFINRKKDPEVRNRAWIKHIAYFIITNILFFSIALDMRLFRILALVIVIAGFAELTKLFVESRFSHRWFFLASIFVLAVLSASFILFSKMEQGLVMFAFLILCIFDGFSQVTGQILGRTKLFPKVSPNKTVEGFIGGAIFAILSSLVFQGLIPGTTPVRCILLGTVVVIFAFAGDTAKSVYKRKFGVKDFSRLIPGHGGFLDRFDSLIAGGAGVALLSLLTSF